MMEVILLERIEKLGFMGDTVKVKDGYARNFLLPQKKALRKTKANMAVFEARKAELEALNLKRRSEAEQVAARMEGLTLIMIRQAGEGGQLYGSVSARDITDGLKAEGYVVSRQQVLLNQPIKDLGRYETRVSLHPEVVVPLVVVVARTEDEARAVASDEAEAEAEEDMVEEDSLEAELDSELGDGDDDEAL
ncbi:50S ribosomal protein L9 [Pararhodospirillum oryzae]|uniref:Large ribosomal subunit protein bL9 n=2 Tax=Pararhodospirillum oryzae TaxID=478448 RepID=A0A512H5F4_9PROT|nr:50S ribosomal protein L9 [Pararhodospirillum oryzae]